MTLAENKRSAVYSVSGIDPGSDARQAELSGIQKVIFQAPWGEQIEAEAE